MSINQFIDELEAVTKILDEWVTDDDEYWEERLGVDRFTALWQAVELMSRAHYYITAQLAAELSQQALVIPDVVTTQPTDKKAARLYGANGKPIL